MKVERVKMIANKVYNKTTIKIEKISNKSTSKIIIKAKQMLIIDLKRCHYPRTELNLKPIQTQVDFYPASMIFQRYKVNRAMRIHKLKIA